MPLSQWYNLLKEWWLGRIKWRLAVRRWPFAVRRSPSEVIIWNLGILELGPLRTIGKRYNECDAGAGIGLAGESFGDLHGCFDLHLFPDDLNTLADHIHAQVEVLAALRGIGS